MENKKFTGETNMSKWRTTGSFDGPTAAMCVFRGDRVRSVFWEEGGYVQWVGNRLENERGKPVDVDIFFKSGEYFQLWKGPGPASPVVDWLRKRKGLIKFAHIVEQYDIGAVAVIDLLGTFYYSEGANSLAKSTADALRAALLAGEIEGRVK